MFRVACKQHLEWCPAAFGYDFKARGFYPSLLDGSFSMFSLSVMSYTKVPQRRVPAVCRDLPALVLSSVVRPVMLVAENQSANHQT